MQRSSLACVWSGITKALLVIFLSAGFLTIWAQTGPTARPEQAPKTAPQVQQSLASFEGQKVLSVELAGQPDLNTAQLEPLLAQHAGEPFSQAKVNQSAEALRRTGRFQSVELEMRPEAEGVRVLLVLQPAVYFGIYQFPGALGPFAYSRLLQVADYPPRGAYTPIDVQNAQKDLSAFFRRNGYFQNDVQTQIITDRTHGIANVIFHSTLNKKAKFGKVILNGTSPEETAHLEHVLRSFMARLRSSSIREGKPYSLKTLQNATSYLEGALMKQSHLGAQVKLVGANYDAATNRADIEYNIRPGAPVSVKVEGAHLWSWSKHSLLPVYQQNGLDPELIQEGRQNLVSHFQSQGYFNAQVKTNVQQSPNGETIIYQVSKGPRHKVAEVQITGNTHESEKHLMPAVAVNEAHWFSHGKYSERLVRTSVNNLKRLYQADGYSTVQVTPKVTTRGGNLVVTFRVDEGPQDIVQNLQVEGNKTVPESQLSPNGLEVQSGKPYSSKRIDNDRNHIVAHYFDLGYLTATFRETAQTVGGDKHKLNVVYHIYEGPRVLTASIITLGRGRTRQKLIDQTASLKVEQPLREDQLLAAESRLYQLGVFDWAEIDPRRQITTQTQEDVLVKVHESKRNNITYGLGFEVVNRGGSVPGGTVALPNLPPVGLPSSFKTSERTFWGPRASFEYSRLNMLGNAETLSIGGLAGRLDQRANFAWTDPHFRDSSWTTSFTINGEHSSANPIFTFRQAQVGYQFQKPLNAEHTNQILLRYSLGQTALTQILIPQLVPLKDQHVRLSTVSGTFIRDTRDNPLDAHRGVFDTVELDLNPGFLGSNFDFGRLLGQSAYYKNIGFGGTIWANSVRIGMETPFSGSSVPLSEEFFSGGGSTLRGFPLNGAGPQRTIPACGDPSNPATCSFIRVPVGGTEMLIVNSEFRIPVPLKQGLGIALFYDGGNVFQPCSTAVNSASATSTAGCTSQKLGFSHLGANYTNTIGAGLRYATPIGPVRIDLGHNLNGQPGIKSTQIFITLGQAF